MYHILKEQEQAKENIYLVSIGAGKTKGTLSHLTGTWTNKGLFNMEHS